MVEVRLEAMEREEARMHEMHERVVNGQAALARHIHRRLQRVAQLQRHMAGLYRRQPGGRAQGGTSDGATPTGGVGPAVDVGLDAAMEDLGDGVLVPQMIALDRSGSPAAELRPGVRIGSYEVREMIGAGSFANVYLLARPKDAESLAPPRAAALSAPLLALKAIERRALSDKSASLLASEV